MNPDNIITALTGGIGTGKSYVASRLRHRGIEVYDCDAAAKRLLRESKELQDKLSTLIGKRIFDGRQIDKRAIATFLLANDNNKQAINDIVHPAVARDFEASGLSWLESAIVFESHFNRRTRIDRIVCVSAPTQVRVARIMKRDQISEEQARQWVECQTPQAEIEELSDFIIVNDGKASIDHQLDVLATLTSRLRHV